MPLLTNHELYPSNLDLRGPRYSHTSLNYGRARLDEHAPRLFLENNEDFDVSVRDLYSAGDQEPVEALQQSIRGYKKLLGCFDVNQVSCLPLHHSREDLKSRFIYLYGDDSRDKLRLSREMLTYILTYYQVMPDYLEFLFNFGTQINDRGASFNRFTSLINDTVSSLHRKTSSFEPRWHFQMCFNLKGVTLKQSRADCLKHCEWSVRHVAIHHQYDLSRNIATWIVTKGRRDLLDRYKSLTGKYRRPEDASFGDKRECFRASLTVHKMFCHWAEEDWEPYIHWLEDVLEGETMTVIHDAHGASPSYQPYETHHVQELQYWHEKVSETTAHLQSNVEVMHALSRFYTQLLDDKAAFQNVRAVYDEEIRSFVFSIEQITTIFQMQISRLKLLQSKVHERKGLMSQRLEGQASERAEQLNLNLERDQTRMRTMTVVALVFLPATLVSAIFSTDIIHFQATSPTAANSSQTSTQSDTTISQVFSWLALSRWLEITLPLTALTLCFAWLYSYHAGNAGRPSRHSAGWTTRPKNEKDSCFATDLYEDKHGHLWQIYLVLLRTYKAVDSAVRKKRRSSPSQTDPTTELSYTEKEWVSRMEIMNAV